MLVRSATGVESLRSVTVRHRADTGDRPSMAAECGDELPLAQTDLGGPLRRRHHHDQHVVLHAHRTGLGRIRTEDRCGGRWPGGDCIGPGEIALEPQLTKDPLNHTPDRLHGSLRHHGDRDHGRGGEDALREPGRKGRGEQRLCVGRERADQYLAPAVVQLGEDIVQQEHRIAPGTVA